MSLLEEITPAPRRIMTLFYLIDSSGSMKGTKIGTVNAAMEERIPLLREVAQANDDADIKVAIMQFSSGFEWITPQNGPADLEQLTNWRDLTAQGLTDLGAALTELDKRLSRSEFLSSQTGAYAPVIILLSDGAPTDDWKGALTRIKQNNWFKHAIKIAIDIESGSDRDVLTEFTGNSEAILDAKDKSTLKNMIHKVSVRASEFQSHSKASNDVLTTPEFDSAAIVEEVKNSIESEAVPVSNDEQEWGEW